MRSRPLQLIVWILLACHLAGPVAVPAQLSSRFSGPGGGRVTALVSPSHAPDSLFVATAGGGVFRSRDGGASWQLANDGLDHTEVTALAVDPYVPDTLYAGTAGDGLFRTTNAGHSWHPDSVGLEQARIKTVLTTSDGTVWVGTSHRGILRREPGRDAFVPVGDPAGAPVFGLIVGSSTHYRAATAAGIFETRDGGRTWSDRSGGLPSLFVKALAPDPWHPGRLWAATGKGLAVSLDQGHTWAPADAFPAVETRAVTFPTPHHILTATAAGVFRTTDGGATWDSTALPEHPDVAALLARDAESWLAGTGAGVFATGDGGRTWRERSRGLVATSISALTRHAEDPKTLYAGSAAGRVFVSRNRGRSWTATPEAPGFAPVTALLHLGETSGEPARLLAGVGGTLWSTTDEGRSWRRWGANLPMGRLSALISRADPDQGIVAAVLGEGVFESWDRGRTWHAHGRGLEDEIVRDLAMGSDGTLWAATPSGLFVDPAGLNVWERRAFDPPRGLVALAVGPASRVVAVGTVRSEVLVSVDGGRSFGRHGTAPAILHDLTLTSDSRGRHLTLYATTSRGVFQRLDGSKPSWVPVAGAATEALCLLAGPGSSPAVVYAGTNGRGVALGRALRSPVPDFNRRALPATPPRCSPAAAWNPAERGCP